eukprot:TRINITY_DN105752_c0_g1_i1.p1 TRINITY_DN105752_c0_g1~~TRINITY_DN105752_c0_g1_i1.p1  ORF type:complete len:222 (+),score=30.03 TRINITY_DN105752_c0_g1_i1:25-666(+)
MARPRAAAVRSLRLVALVVSATFTRESLGGSFVSGVPGSAGPADCSAREARLLGAAVATVAPASAEAIFGLSDSYEDLLERYKPDMPPVKSPSSQAEVALAKHLTDTGAVCWCAWWNRECQEQREAFGKDAADLAPFVECTDENRKETNDCRMMAGPGGAPEAYPIWFINGKMYSSRLELTLADLAKISGFKAYPISALNAGRDYSTLEYLYK